MKRELLRRGIPFERHYASKLTKEEVEEVDYIFYMDDSNRYIIYSNYPEHLDKFHPINECSDDIYYIEDPWYTNRFSLVVTQIEKCLKDLLKIFFEK